MNAPRKPVAWMRREVTYRGVDGRTEGERVVSERRVMADDIPLYTDLNLQPLWALVEKFECEAESESRRANKQTAGRDRHIYSAMQRARSEALSDSANELRATLGAMQ